MNIFKRGSSNRERSSTSSSANASYFNNSGTSGYATPDENHQGSSTNSFTFAGLTATLKRAKGKALGQTLNSLKESSALDHSSSDTQFEITPKGADWQFSGIPSPLGKQSSLQAEIVLPDHLPGYNVWCKHAWVYRFLELNERTCASYLINGANITLVDLSSNNLKTIPEQLFEMAQLRKLYLCHNQIETLAHNIARLKLTHLALSGNQISTHDLQIADLGNLENHASPLSRTLEALWLDGNKLNSIGMLLYNFGNLKQLSLARNQIIQIAQDAIPPSVQYLNLSYNILDTVPQTLLEPSSLVSIALSGNPSLENCGFRVLSVLRNKCRIMEIPPSAVNPTRGSVIVSNAHIVKVGKRALLESKLSSRSDPHSKSSGRLSVGLQGKSSSHNQISVNLTQERTIAGSALGGNLAWPTKSLQPAPHLPAKKADSISAEKAYLEDSSEEMSYALQLTENLDQQFKSTTEGSKSLIVPKTQVDYWTQKPTSRNNVISVLPHIKFDVNKFSVGSTQELNQEFRNVLSNSASFVANAGLLDCESFAASISALEDTMRSSDVAASEHLHPKVSASSSNMTSEEPTLAAGVNNPTQAKVLNKRLAQLKLDQSMSELRSMIENGTKQESPEPTMETSRSQSSISAPQPLLKPAMGPPPVKPKPASLKEGFLVNSKSEEFSKRS